MQIGTLLNSGSKATLIAYFVGSIPFSLFFSQSTHHLDSHSPITFQSPQYLLPRFHLSFSRSIYNHFPRSLLPNPSSFSPSSPCPSCQGKSDFSVATCGESVTCNVYGFTGDDASRECGESGDGTCECGGSEGKCVLWELER